MAVLGFIIALGMLFGSSEANGESLIIMPLYFVGMFYAGKTLLKMFGAIVNMYFQYQMMCLFMKPLLGTVICIILLFVGIGIILSFGWIVGLFKCIYSLITAYQLDRECGIM